MGRREEEGVQRCPRGCMARRVEVSHPRLASHPARRGRGGGVLAPNQVALGRTCGPQALR